MASIQSNLPEIRKVLSDLADTLRPSRKRSGSGSGRSIGNEFLDLTAVLIEHRTIVEQRDPDDMPLAPLSPVTIGRKVRLGYPTTIGIETHHMLDLDQIKGQQQVTANTAEMTYGLDEEARDKAGRFTEGNSHQPERPFFDLGRSGEQLLDDYIEDVVIAEQIRTLS
jgi:hypothetical protein